MVTTHNCPSQLGCFSLRSLFSRPSRPFSRRIAASWPGLTLRPDVESRAARRCRSKVEKILVAPGAIVENDDILITFAPDV